MSTQTSPNAPTVKHMLFICADHANQFARILAGDFYGWRIIKHADGIHEVEFWRTWQ